MRTTTKFFLCLLVMGVWVFSGWPQIWNNPSIPPQIQPVRAYATLTYVGGAEASGNSANYNVDLTNLTGGIASSPATGDLVIVATGWVSTANGDPGVTTSGYTEVADLYANDTRDANFSVNWKIMAGTPDTSVTCKGSSSASNGAVCVVHVWRNTNTSKPLDATTTTATLNNSTNQVNSPSITPVTPGAIVISTGLQTSTAVDDSITAPSGYGNQVDISVDPGNAATAGISSKAWSGSGAEDPAAWTNWANTTSDSWAAATLAIRPAVAAPTVTTQAASSVEDTTATCNGNITDTGGTNATARGCEWDTDSGAPYANSASDSGSYGTGAFTKGLTGLPSGTTIYARAFATNSAGTGYGSEVNFLTKPAAPTDVSATDGTYTDKVTITWTKSTGATNYRVYRDGSDISGSLGDVATYDDTSAAAPTITPGSTVASDGASTAQVNLSLSGTAANNGTTHTYGIAAFNATHHSASSTSNTGYRGVGSLTYQWQRSSGPSDGGYSDISGATAATYNDTGAPAPTVTPGTASATDGSATDKVTLSISGASAANGAIRYYKCVLNATGATQQTSTANDGYRGVGSLTYQWYRSSGTGDSDFSTLSGATTEPYDDTTAPTPTITPGTASASDGTYASYVILGLNGQSANVGAGRYYYCAVGAEGASSQDTNHNSGYRGVGSLSYQWQRSAADSDADYSNISNATTSSYYDTGAPSDGSGRYYKCVENADGATQQTSTADRGYKAVVAISLTTNGSVTFGALAASSTHDTTPSDHNDKETVRVDSGGLVDLDIRSTNFTQGANTWTLNTSHGPNQVKWEFASTSPGTWTTFAVADTLYALDGNVAQDGTRDIYLRITMPSETSSYEQYGATVTIVASAP